MNRIKHFLAGWTVFEKSWLIVSSILIFVLSLLWGDSVLAIFSSLTGIISVVLCAKGKIENYAFGLINAITYAYICYQANIFGETMYNILMIPMIIIGIISWKKNMEDDNSEVKARNLTPVGWIILIIGSIAAVAVYSFILNLIGGEFALVDATSTTFSVIATILMLARYSEQWVMWIVVNVVSVILWALAFASGEGSGITYLVMWIAYLFNSVYGYVNWRKMAQK